MLETKLTKIFRFWFPLQLPDEHAFLDPARMPDSQKAKARIYLRKWFVHPIKRRLAKYYIWLLQNGFGLKVIAITGSAGKTSTKDFLASILSREAKTVKSYKNIDPIYNIPTTIFKCRPDTKFLVLEMGVEYPGEMDFYCWLVRPDISVITNIYPAHTEFFGDEHGVFVEKTKLLKYTKSAWVLNKEDKHLRGLGTRKGIKVIWFNTKSDLDCKKIELPLLGAHFESNAKAAAAVANFLGVSQSKIIKGLENSPTPEHRMEVHKLKSGRILIDDSYNNNPEAAKATIDAFEKHYKAMSKILIFGDMLELGKLSKTKHRQLGSYIYKHKIENLICIGKASEITASKFKKLGGQADFYKSWQEALPKIKTLFKPKTAMLIKGSRSLGLENLVERLRKLYYNQK